MEHLHIVLLPLMAHGHMIPTLDMAKLFTSRGIKTTIIATPQFSHPITTAQQSGHNINLITIQFPPLKSSLPQNTPPHDLLSPPLLSKFVEALSLLQEPVEEILQQLKPNCLISDMLFPWTNTSAVKFGIPRLVFHGTCCFSLCVSEQIQAHEPYRNVSSDSEPFVVPGHLPNELWFLRSQLPPLALEDDEQDGFSRLLRQVRECDKSCYGVVFNSFYGLESAYADYYATVMGRRSWHVGPLLLCRGGGARDKTWSGEEPCIDEHECSSWLDSKRPDSVVYVCFGSMVTFSRAQLHEIAAGLEASGRDFIWVVRQGKSHNADGEEDEEDDDWFLPDRGFEQRVGEKGLIIRGWASQLMILDHPSVGAFVTHCGWNSILEGICAGVPMVTWPIFAEQFFNEKLVTEVLGIGVPVGSKKWGPVESESVGREAVEAAVRRVMAAEEMRKRCEGFKEMGRKAVEEGGSSYCGLNALIDELSNYNATNN